MERKEKINTREVGTTYEQIACDFLQKEGLRVIETNFRTRMGEIDIIAQDKNEIVFIEVKYRKDTEYGGAPFAISRSKQQTIVRVAQVYIKMRKLPVHAFYRFDAVLIDGADVRHIKNAWQA